MAKSSIVFNVTVCQETGGYIARWDDKPGHGGITTQGETLSELEEMIADAVGGYFETDRPQKSLVNIEARRVFDMETASKKILSS